MKLVDQAQLIEQDWLHPDLLDDYLLLAVAPTDLLHPRDADQLDRRVHVVALCSFRNRLPVFSLSLIVVEQRLIGLVGLALLRAMLQRFLLCHERLQHGLLMLRGDVVSELLLLELHSAFLAFVKLLWADFQVHLEVALLHPRAAVQRTIDLELPDQLLDDAAEPELRRERLLALRALPLRQAVEAPFTHYCAAGDAIKWLLRKLETDNALEVVEVHPLAALLNIVSLCGICLLLEAAWHLQIGLLVEVGR